MAKILVIDDSSTQLHAYVSILQRHQHTVLKAKNGEEGITIAVKQRPELILMDIVMPQMDGFSATRKLKQSPETATIPVIILSNKDQETDRLWGLRQGAAEYLVKPIEERTLIDTINLILRKNQLP